VLDLQATIFSPARSAASVCLKVKHSCRKGPKDKVNGGRSETTTHGSGHSHIPSMICHLQCPGPASGGFGFGAACFREMSNSIPDCICTDTAVASLVLLCHRPFLVPTPIALSTSTKARRFLSPRLRRPTVCGLEPTPTNGLSWCVWGNDPPAAQLYFPRSAGQNRGTASHTVTSHTTLRVGMNPCVGVLYFMPRVVPSQRLSICIRKHILHPSHLYMV